MKGNRYISTNTPTENDDDSLEGLHNDIIYALNRYDLELAEHFSDHRRFVQLCQEHKKRLQGRSSNLNGVEIPAEFTSAKEKITYLDFVRERTMVAKKRVKRDRVAIAEYLSMLEVCKTRSKH